MIDHVAAQLAMRARAIGLVTPGTGVTTLAATTTGYTRAAGSFITDGFRPGMELTPLGFTNNPVDLVLEVNALSLSVRSAQAADSAGAGRSLTVGLPTLRAWEDVDFTPVVGRPYVADAWIPGTARGISLPVTTGTLEETGLYRLQLYGVSGFGLGTRALATRLLARFASGTTMDPLGDGTTVVRVRSDVGPTAGQLLPLDGGWSCITLTIPWRAFSPNAIAA